MNKLMDLISEEVTKVFVQEGYDPKYGKVTVSNRPDLCEFQCNGAMAAAKDFPPGQEQASSTCMPGSGAAISTAVLAARSCT